MTFKKKRLWTAATFERQRHELSLLLSARELSEAILGMGEHYRVIRALQATTRVPRRLNPADCTPNERLLDTSVYPHAAHTGPVCSIFHLRRRRRPTGEAAYLESRQSSLSLQTTLPPRVCQSRVSCVGRCLCVCFCHVSRRGEGECKWCVSCDASCASVAMPVVC